MGRQIFIAVVGYLLAATVGRTAEPDAKEIAQELGSILAWRLAPQTLEERCRSADPDGAGIREKALKAWQDKNARLIEAVDTRVAEVMPLVDTRSNKDDAVKNVREQVKAILLEGITSGRSAEELKAMCHAEANPASPRWNNSGMPHVQQSLAALYDWKVRIEAK